MDHRGVDKWVRLPPCRPSPTAQCQLHLWPAFPLRPSRYRKSPGTCPPRGDLFRVDYAPATPAPTSAGLRQTPLQQMETSRPGRQVLRQCESEPKDTELHQNVS